MTDSLQFAPSMHPFFQVIKVRKRFKYGAPVGIVKERKTVEQTILCTNLFTKLWVMTSSLFSPLSNSKFTSAKACGTERAALFLSGVNLIGFRSHVWHQTLWLVNQYPPDFHLVHGRYKLPYELNVQVWHQGNPDSNRWQDYEPASTYEREKMSHLQVYGPFKEILITTCCFCQTCYKPVAS